MERERETRVERCVMCRKLAVDRAFETGEWLCERCYINNQEARNSR